MQSTIRSIYAILLVADMAVSMYDIHQLCIERRCMCVSQGDCGDRYDRGKLRSSFYSGKDVRHPFI